MSKYIGIFERLKTLYPDELKEIPFYYDECVGLYDRIAKQYDDLPIFLQQVRSYGGPILELCCGTGRVTLPLLKENVHITALDLSAHMLEKMKEKVSASKQYKKYQKNLDIICGDMHKIDLRQKYNLIIIAATSIRLVEGDFAAFFDSMYDLLNSGGVLFFNFEHIPIRRDIDEYLEPITVGDLPLDEGKFNLVCIQRLIDYKNRKAYVNFLEVRPQTNRRQILSGTEYRIFGCEDIKEAAEKSKFHKCNLIHTEDGVNWFCKMMKK